MRSTVYSIPCNQDMLKESGIPMAVISTPFAKIPEDEVCKIISSGFKDKLFTPLEQILALHHHTVPTVVFFVRISFIIFPLAPTEIR